MSTVLMADGKALMCDKCDQHPARYYVQGLTHLSLYDGLCGNCCRAYLLSIGDTIGADKFKELI
jgi:hypothetical protein